MEGKEKQLELRIGAVAPSLKQQLTAQGFKFDAHALSFIEDDKNAISRLYIRGYLTDTQAEKMKNKIYNKVKATIKPSK